MSLSLHTLKTEYQLYRTRTIEEAKEMFMLEHFSHKKIIQEKHGVVINLYITEYTIVFKVSVFQFLGQKLEIKAVCFKILSSILITITFEEAWFS